MPDALSRMGLSRRPELEFFKFPKGMASDPRYSQEFREDLRADQDIQRESRILDLQDREIAQQERAQRAVNQFTRQDPSTRQQFLEENADIALSPQFGRLAQQQSLATRTLAPSLARKLPPAAARRFYENVDQGMEANDAFEEARDFLEQESYRERLAPFASDDEIKQRFPEGRFSAPEVARFEYEQKKKIGQDPALENLQDYYKMLNDADKADAARGIVNPELQAKKAKAMADIEERIKVRIAPAQTAASAAVPVADVAFSPVPLRDTLKGLSGDTVEPTLGPLPEEVETQVMKHAASPEADENFFTTAITNPKLSEAARRTALEKFRAFVKNPPPKEGMTIGESLGRQQTLRDQLAKAEADFDLVPEQQKYNAAWDTAKKQVDDIIDRFAKSLGVGKDQVINSLVKDERIPVPGREAENFRMGQDLGGIPVTQLLSEFQTGKKGGPKVVQIWEQPAEALAPFEKSKFADRLSARGKTNRDVLDAYLKDVSKSPTPEKPATEEKLPEPKTKEEADKLPPGTKFRDPKGQVRIIPAPKP